MVCLCPFVRTKGRVIAGQGNKRRLALLLYFLRQSQTTGNRLYFSFLVRQFYLMVFSVDQWKPARFSMNLGGIIKQSCEAEVGMIETKRWYRGQISVFEFVFLFVSVFVFANTR